VFFECVVALLCFPNAKILCCGRKDVFARALDVRDPHDFGGREFVLELIDFSESVVGFAKVKINYIYLVVHGVCVVGTHCHLEFVIFARSECNSVVVEVALVGINLLCQTVVRQVVDLILNVLHLA
jgi:hypothetical protein